MLPTFVIGLREGLEAALIIGIIAAFLRTQCRRDLLRWVFVGVGVAALLCLAVGVALDVLQKDLPQRQQEGLETVIGAVAVGMVTYMVVWMKRHSRELKGQLEGMARDAMGGTSAGARAMVAMAFLAVLREGLETAVFLLAAFNQSTSGAGAPVGAVLGVAVAIVLGYGIYRGGLRINLSRFFRVTGLVLVVVAAGLVVNVLHTAHEAGWLDIGQGGTVDLTWLVEPGSVQASLLTGMLGLQAQPVVIEVIGWLLYLVPVGVFVAWPPGKSLARRTTSRALLAGGAALAVAAAVLAIAAPGAPASGPVTRSDGTYLTASVTGDAARITATAEPDGGSTVATYAVTRSGSDVHDGVAVDTYRAQTKGTGGEQPTTLTFERIAELNGGNLPIGVKATEGGALDAAYTDRVTTTALLDHRTARVVALRSVETLTATVVDPSRGTFVLPRPVTSRTVALSAADAEVASAAARADRDTVDHRALLIGLAWSAGVLAFIALLAGLGLAISPSERERRAATTPTRAVGLVKT